MATQKGLIATMSTQSGQILLPRAKAELDGNQVMSRDGTGIGKRLHIVMFTSLSLNKGRKAC